CSSSRDATFALPAPSAIRLSAGALSSVERVNADARRAAGGLRAVLPRGVPERRPRGVPDHRRSRGGTGRGAGGLRPGRAATAPRLADERARWMGHEGGGEPCHLVAPAAAAPAS